MIHRLVRLLFLLDGIVLAASLAGSRSTGGIYSDPIQNSLWWHLLSYDVCFHFSNRIHLCFTSQTFNQLTTEPKISQKCSWPASSNNIFNESKNERQFPEHAFDVGRMLILDCRKTKVLLGKKKHILKLSIFCCFCLGGSGKSPTVPKSAKTRAKCPKLTYGSKALNLQPAAVNS